MKWEVREQLEKKEKIHGRPGDQQIGKGENVTQAIDSGRKEYRERKEEGN